MPGCVGSQIPENGPGLEFTMWRLDVAENPDWGYARNLQLILKTRLAEYSSSVFSAPVEAGGLTYYGGNRDYSWQGLVVGPVGRALYKAVDGLYYSTDLRLTATEVLYEPGQCTYAYEGPRGEAFLVKITLDDWGGRICLRAAANRPCWFTVPLDLRPADACVEAKYAVQWQREGVSIRSTATPLTLVMRGFTRTQPLDRTLDWRYKLGDGFRQIKDGLVVFSEHRRPVYLPFALYCPGGVLDIEVSGESGLLPSLGRSALPASVHLGTGKVAQALGLRLQTLCSFGVSVDGSWFPEAGAWWFRRPWTRDALEGLRWNLRTYVHFLGRGGAVESLVLKLLDLLKSGAGLPLVHGDQNGFSADAPPILLGVAADLAVLTKSRGLASRALDVSRHVCERLLSGQSLSGSVLELSVICSPANSSWVDSVISVAGKRWPTRLLEAWAGQELDPFGSEYGLVEVNALYIEALGKLSAMCNEMGLGVPDGFEELRGELIAGFRSQFKREGALPFLTVVPCRRLSDPTAGSSALVALACLQGSVYRVDELRTIWKQFAKDLLVERSLVALGRQRLPFGVLVKAGGERPYLGDEEYHGPTVWPRDTPYLVKCLEAIGGDVGGILLNNLDHMIAEGAFGYCGELFSLPVGRSPDGASDNPVPVKNPAQYWSHWCDPYLDHLNELGISGPDPTFAHRARSSREPRSQC